MNVNMRTHTKSVYVCICTYSRKGWKHTSPRKRESHSAFVCRRTASDLFFFLVSFSGVRAQSARLRSRLPEPNESGVRECPRDIVFMLAVAAVCTAEVVAESKAIRYQRDSVPLDTGLNRNLTLEAGAKLSAKRLVGVAPVGRDDAGL